MELLTTKHFHNCTVIIPAKELRDYNKLKKKIGNFVPREDNWRTRDKIKRPLPASQTRKHPVTTSYLRPFSNSSPTTSDRPMVTSAEASAEVSADASADADTSVTATDGNHRLTHFFTIFNRKIFFS